MAIKLPDPGNGIPEQKTGNDEWTNMKIVRDNFADQSNAASRLVGTEDNNIVQAKDLQTVYGGNWTYREGAGLEGGRMIRGSYDDIPLQKLGWLRVGHETTVLQGPPKRGYSGMVKTVRTSASTTDASKDWYKQDYCDTEGTNLYHAVRLRARRTTSEASSDSLWGPWHYYYTTANTHEHGANGYLKPSSPILMIHNDRMTSNTDGEGMRAIYTKKGVGDYEITGTTGLRLDGWYIEIPNDLHGNPHVAVTIEETDGTIRLKCFKRVFNMETFKFEPDLNNPMDIPEGRWIDLRFNDLPEEQLDEPIE